MRLSHILLASLSSVQAFVTPSPKHVRPSVAVRAFDDADSLLDKLSKTDSTSFAPAAPAVTPVVVDTPPVVVEAAPIPAVADVVTSAAAPPVEAVAPVVDQVTSSGADLTASFGDLPIVPIAIGAIAVIGAVVALSGGGGDEGASSTPSPAPAAAAPAAAPASDAADLSIPYDAAAALAYEKAGSPGDYASFKAKYEADAIAEVKAKQK